MAVALTMTQLFGLIGSTAAFMALSASRHRPVTENVGLAMVAHHVVLVTFRGGSCCRASTGLRD